jgi:hypothetical protein
VGSNSQIVHSTSLHVLIIGQTTICDIMKFSVVALPIGINVSVTDRPARAGVRSTRAACLFYTAFFTGLIPVTKYALMQCRRII